MVVGAKIKLKKPENAPRGAHNSLVIIMKTIDLENIPTRLKLLISEKI